MEKIENKEAGLLYERVKDIFFSFKNEPTYNYDKHQHHLYEESEHPGISRDFYNENGSVEFVNFLGDTIVFELSRFHSHQHNGWSGLCASPCRLITINKKCGDEQEELWRLEVVCRTMHYEGNVTSKEIPFDLLKKEEVKADVEVIDDKTSNKDSVESCSEIVDEVDLNSELIDIKEKYENSIKDRDRLIEEQDREIKLAIKRIKDSYESRINECDLDREFYKSAIDKYDSVVSMYSTFDSNVIGIAIQYLISMIECSNYSYIEVPYIFKERVHGTIDSWDEDREAYIGIVVSSDDKTSYIREKELDKVLDKGAFLLFKSSKNNGSITFYSSNSGKCSSVCDFSRYPYIKEFIDYVIKYRFNKKSTDITSEEIVELLHKFLENYQDMIVKRYSNDLKNKIYSIHF